MIDQVVFEISVDGLRQLEQAMIEESPGEAKKDAANYFWNVKPKQLAITALREFVERRPDLTIEDRRRIGEWFHMHPDVEVNVENLKAVCLAVQVGHADKHFVSEQL